MMSTTSSQGGYFGAAGNYGSTGAGSRNYEPEPTMAELMEMTRRSTVKFQDGSDDDDDDDEEGAENDPEVNIAFVTVKKMKRS